MLLFGALVLTTAVAVASQADLLALSPWHGKVPAAANPDAVAYRLSVRGAPNAVVHLHASGLAPGWIASFCTARVCSPSRVALPLSAAGSGTIEFQVIRDDDAAPHRTHVIVSSDSGGLATLDVKR